MSEVHGIVYAYRSSARLGDLTRWRTNASLPFCGRYRLIDFALSSLSNAGVHSVGVIMQRDYQSLLDHLGSGKAWDLSRRSGGLHLLPPFGVNTRGDYAGTAEALNAVISYVRAIPEPEIVLMPADVVCNLDLAAAIAQHEAGGCGITAICRDGDVTGEHHRFLTDAHGRVTKLITSAAPDAGLTSMEAYIVDKDVLLAMLDLCAQENRAFFHRDALFPYLARGGTMDVFLHRGYAVRVDTVADYFSASMDMLEPLARASLFPAERPVRTKERADVSTYYGEHAHVENCLVADGCFIEGTVTDCILFPGVRVARGAQLSRCIVMQDTCIAADAILRNVIADKNVRIGPAVMLTGCEALPIVIPKGSEL